MILCLGTLVAFGIALLIGLIWPSIKMGIFIILCIFQMRVGWSLASSQIRHQNDSIEPKIEDINSPEIQKEIDDLMKFKKYTSWIYSLTEIGAVITSFWLIYKFFVVYNWWVGISSFIALAIIYGFGLSPMFVITSSILCFYFKSVGLWLPLFTYACALITLYLDIRKTRLKRKIDPFNIMFR